MFFRLEEIGNLMTKLVRSASTLFTTVIFLASASTVLVLFILSVLTLNLVLPSLGNWLMQERLAICQVALRPVACDSKAMTHR